MKHDDTSGTKRSQECTFCKRGLTNAQASGGHMNIHRNDRKRGDQGLQIGPNHINDNIHQVKRENQKESELDLEVRLGHDPY